MIEISKMDEVTFCILVLWLNGCFTTSEISTAAQVTTGRVKSVVRCRAQGGLMPRPRDELSLAERQEILTFMKDTRVDDKRIDNGRLKHDWCFVASELKQRPRRMKPELPPAPDPSTREGRKQIQKRRKEEARLAKIAEERRLAREMGGNTLRGKDGDPLESLYKGGLLSDPPDVAQTSAGRMSAQMRRYEAGTRFQKFMQDSQIGGFKEINMEVSTGGSGMPIQERFMVAQSSVRAIRAMMRDTEFMQIELIAFYGDFTWTRIPSKIARQLALEEIRRGLDVVALFLLMMSEKAFEDRWGAVPRIERAHTRSSARAAAQEARELIAEGGRTS